MLPRWLDVILNTAGEAVAASVTVTTWRGATAVLYADILGTTPLSSNVLTTDIYGQYGFYAPSGHYTLTTTVAGQVVDTRDISLGTGTIYNPEYFGIMPGTQGEITAGLQAWIDELVGASHTNFPSGFVPSGIIQLPHLRATCDSIVTHPAISVLGNTRGGTFLTMKAGATPVGVDNLPAMFYIVARARSNTANPAWMPEFRNLRMDGNGVNQGTVDCSGIYAEPVANDNSGAPFSAIGYSAFLAGNCDLTRFSGDGAVSGTGRQRLTLVDRFRSTINGRYDLSGNPLNTAAGVRVNGNQGVLIGIGAGGNSGHGVVASGTSGLLMTGCNVWGPESIARSNNGVALALYNCNGFGITANVFNDTISIDGGGQLDRSSTIAGNQLKPNDPVFTSDGVTQGTADSSFNCHIRVSRSQNISIGQNGYGSGGSTGNRYQYCVIGCNGAVASADFSSTSYYNLSDTPPNASRPWAANVSIPVQEQDTAKISVSFTDLNKSAQFSNRVQAGVEGRNQVFVVQSSVSNPQVIAPTAQLTFLKFTGTQAAMTLQLPYPPVEGVRYEVTTVTPITSLTVALSAQAVSDGQTINSSPTTLAANGTVKMLYQASTKQWWWML